MNQLNKVVFLLLLVVIFTNTRGVAQTNELDTIPSKRLIVFVHGFGGGIGAWEGDSTKFYEALFKNEKIIRNYDASFFSYNTKKVEWIWLKSFLSIFFKKIKFNAPIKTLGLRLVSELNSRKYKKYESIVLITHSMGGLVAKSAMIQMHNDRNLNNILAKINSYISLSVPHNGSQIATKAEFLNILLGPNPQLINLKAFSDLTSELTMEYSNLENPAKAIYMWGSNDKVVKSGSAYPSKNKKDIYVTTGDNHSDIRIIKDKKKHISYDYILEELENLLSNQTEKLAPDITFKDVDEKPEVKERVEKYFVDYSNLVSSSLIQLPKELPKFYIENDNDVCDGGYYFDSSKKVFHFLVRNDMIASDKDLINRIHSHAILHNQVKCEEIDEFYKMRRSGDRSARGGLTAAIESGICDYLVASYSNDPKIGETGYAKCKDVLFLRNISTVVKFKDISFEGDSFYKQGVAWSGFFWELEQAINDKNKVRRLAIEFWQNLWLEDKNFREWNLPKSIGTFDYIFQNSFGDERYKHVEEAFRIRGIERD